MTTSATLFMTGTNHQIINVRSPYLQSFVDEARRDQVGTWNKELRTWQFDTSKGVTLSWVKQLCARHYGENAVHVSAGEPIATTTPDQGHMGLPGDRLALLVQVVKAVDLAPGQYGVARLTIMRNVTGHVFVWRASRERLDVGEIVTLEGTVKRHDTYRNVSQTVLSRCKVVSKATDEQRAAFLSLVDQPNHPAQSAPMTLAASTAAAQRTLPQVGWKRPEGYVLEWFEQPWTCGHSDPIYTGSFSQQCAVCGIERTDPNLPKAVVVDEPAKPRTLAEEVGF